MTGATSWVVYLIPVHKKEPAKAVCRQSEWESLERLHPGYHTLVQAGIATEGEAETIARGEPAVGPKQSPKSRSRWSRSAEPAKTADAGTGEAIGESPDGTGDKEAGPGSPEQ